MDNQWFNDNQDVIEKYFGYSYWLECDLLLTIKALISTEGFAYFDILQRAAIFYGPIQNELPNGLGVNYTVNNDESYIEIGDFKDGYITKGHVIW